MAKLMQAFNARNVDPTQGMGGLPIGKYPVVIIKSEVKPTKDNDSGYLQLDLQVTEGENQGAVGAYRLNLYHTNQQTVEIAHRQLSAVCHVTGVFELTDSQQLHNIPFVIEVGLQKEPNPNKYTEVKRVFDMGGNEPTLGGAPQNNNNQGGGNGGQNNGAGWGQQGDNNNGQQGGNNGGGWGQQGGQNQQPDNQNQNGNNGGGWNNGGGDQNQNNNGGGWQQNNNGGGNGNKPAWG